MATCSGDAVALACVPDAIAPDERKAHFALAHQIFGELVRERAEMADGYAFRFDPDALELVARFIANERKCCPFLSFELEIVAGSETLWLRMTGPEGTRAFLEAEQAAFSCGANQAIKEIRPEG